MSKPLRFEPLVAVHVASPSYDVCIDKNTRINKKILLHLAISYQCRKIFIYSVEKQAIINRYFRKARTTIPTKHSTQNTQIYKTIKTIRHETPIPKDITLEERIQMIREISREIKRRCSDT